MAIITQKQIFGWKELKKLGDLERLKLTLDYLPDEKLMQELEKLRDKGTDKYPVRATWNSYNSRSSVSTCISRKFKKRIAKEFRA